MPDLTEQPEEKKNRKGPAVINENCTIKMSAFDAGLERWKCYHESKALDPVKHVYGTSGVEKQRLDEKQRELYEAANEKT